MARVRPTPIPVTVVVGLRGAGKTTLINRMLGDAAFADTAVILNDFGETKLSGGGAVERAEDGFLELGSGCVCCAVRGALTDGLENLLRDLDNGRVASIGRVVIEADAAADPAAILAAVERHPYLALRFVADGIAAVVDATAPDVDKRAEAVRQIAMADIVALSRFEAGMDAHGLVRALNPATEVVDAATVDPRALVGHRAFDPSVDDLDAWLGGAGGAGASSVTLGDEAARIRAFSVDRPRTMSFARLDRFIEYLAMLQAPNLVRVRGAVATAEDETVIVDGIGGFFRPPLVVDRSQPVAIRFAVVARDLDRVTFERYLDAFLGEARVDTPDATALTASPLTIAGFSARSGK